MDMYTQRKYSCVHIDLNMDIEFLIHIDSHQYVPSKVDHRSTLQRRCSPRVPVEEDPRKDFGSAVALHHLAL